jgi:hypothetical protein
MRKAESDVTEMVKDEKQKVYVNREKPWQNKLGLDLHLAGNSFLWAFTIHILYVWW